MHLLVGIAALLLAFGCFAMGWIGGDDAKLFAATALWMGPELIFAYALTAALIGGALTLLILFWRGMPLPRRFCRADLDPEAARRQDRQCLTASPLPPAGSLPTRKTAFMAGIGH